MSKERTFNGQYYLDAIQRIDIMIANGKLSNDEISLLKDEKLYLFQCLGITPRVDKKDISLYMAFDKINKKMCNQFNNIGIENIDSLISMANFIIRHHNNREITFKKNDINKEALLSEGVNFFENFNDEFYQIINRLVNHKENLYNFTNDDRMDDECIFLLSKKLPIVHIYDTGNTLLYVKVIHEMQHQIDYMYRYINGNKNPNYCNLLSECSAIFIELLFSDHLSLKYPHSDDINNLYLERINHIESISLHIGEYLQIMKYLYINNKKLTFDFLERFLQSYNKQYSRSFLLKYVSSLLNYNLYSNIKYLFSYLLALNIRETYYNDSKEAINKIKHIINLKVYNDSFSPIIDNEIKLSEYAMPYNHLKHTMQVENKKLQLHRKIN